jgi:hypothetical protein
MAGSLTGASPGAHVIRSAWIHATDLTQRTPRKAQRECRENRQQEYDARVRLTPAANVSPHGFLRELSLCLPLWPLC